MDKRLLTRTQHRLRLKNIHQRSAISHVCKVKKDYVVSSLGKFNRPINPEYE